MVIQWIKSLPLRPRVFVEPFAGGASVGLAVAELALADQVFLIERDSDVAAVWKVALGPRYRALQQRIVNFRIGRQRVREVLDGDEQDLISVAFRCLLRNRVQRGGILAARAGLLRRGERNRGLGSRWYPKTLAARLKKIHSLRHCIRVTQEDAMHLLPDLLSRADHAFFIDPPYTVNGQGPGMRLYRYANLDHDKLFALLAESDAPCLATFHASPAIRQLARQSRFRVSTVGMHTTHHRARREMVLCKPYAERITCWNRPVHSDNRTR